MAEGELKLQLRTLNGGATFRSLGGQFRKKIVGAALDEMVDAWGRQAVASLREATPVEQERPDQPWRQHPAPGSARESWRWDHVPTQHAVKVSNTQSHTLYLFAGTRPHLITPKTEGGWLKFFWAREGHWEWARRIEDHPGTEPVPELVEAMNRLNVTAEVMFHETAEKIVTTIMQPIAGIGDE